MYKFTSFYVICPWVDNRDNLSKISTEFFNPFAYFSTNCESFWHNTTYAFGGYFQNLRQQGQNDR